MQKYKITTESVGLRIDKYLTALLPEFSRSKIQKMIKDSIITVNDKDVSVHYFLRENDIINIKGEKSPVVKKIAAIKKTKAKNLQKLEVKVIANTDDYIVIEKPAGLVVHPDEHHQSADTVIGRLIAQFPELKNLKPAERPGVVHRLDKDVSGLMVIAKTMKMQKSLVKQFQTRKVLKEYIALVYGKMPDWSGVIDFPIDRSAADAKKFVAKPKSQEAGKEAITEWDTVQKFVNYTLLNIRIKTGRTHQIRVHMHSVNHPIVGDRLYKNIKLKTNIELDRPFLHSHKLGFFDADKKWVEFESKLPAQLKAIIKDLN